MPETYEFEISSESGRERHLRVPWARMADATPTKGQAALVLGLIDGQRITGTVINAGTTTTDEYALINTANGRQEMHNVRNVLTYNAGPVAEATWGPINFGDAIYYDAEQDTLNGVKLSTSPLQSDGVTVNPLFGYAILGQDELAADFPKGTNLAGSTNEVGVLGVGPSMVE